MCAPKPFDNTKCVGGLLQLAEGVGINLPGDLRGFLPADLEHKGPVLPGDRETGHLADEPFQIGFHINPIPGPALPTSQYAHDSDVGRGARERFQPT
jgi:hypothetical protein